ncbi:MAG TPA: 2,3-bisphosphoglycerate-independent phosphoglycerate mutase [Anaerolineae bacterium]|nr:2,3-bisphosphoglycerate-independent phosphoglycerate mutase [Anaerolineae bacterium]HPL30634.1 2,3-bisphosphoglycerate-independent phosphoglycerate mutase [Anaerolineae bacterium]
MTDFALLKDLVVKNTTKIVLLVLDGIGGLPVMPGGPTALEAAHTSNMDRLAAEGICGLHEPIGPGITPGSGPSHLAVFGYDPIKYEIGRGVLEAVGIDFALTPQDLAARGNFCTVDAAGNITDRRAGRIATEISAKLAARLQAEVKLPGVQVFVSPVREHRFVLVLRGEGLVPALSETDPQVLGKPPLPVQPLAPKAAHTADLVNRFVDQARRILADAHPANMVLLRGFAKHPTLPQMADVYGLRAAAIAAYPMYRGLAKLVGMTALPTGMALDDEFAALEQGWADYDYFYLHVKKTDSSGEDGNYEAKVHVIEEVDRLVPRLMALKPDVVVITGDHSTPAALKGHSWHPVPTLLWAPTCRPDLTTSFGERACTQGSLGRFPAVDIMPLALAHALRLTKFGA